MLARPITDFVLIAAWSTVAIWPVAVVVLQEFLVLALQVLLEDDMTNVNVAVLISETGFLQAVRRVEIRIVVDLAGAC